MRKWTIAPYVTFGFSQNQLKCGFGSIQIAESNREKQTLYLKLATLFKTPMTEAQVLAKFSKPEQKSIEAAIEVFKEHKLLVPTEYLQEINRYHRHLLFYTLSGANPHRVQKKLLQSHVLILGCGGIGNIISLILATSGVGTLTLVDNDHIELSNLTRQILFTEKDVGKNKNDVLKNCLLARNSHLQIQSYKLLVTRPEDLASLPKADLWIVSADQPAGLIHWINHYCVEQKQAYINVGYVQDIAVWGPMVIPQQTACFACQKVIADGGSTPELEKINQGYQAPSCGPINMLAASLACLDILKYLGDFAKPHSYNTRIGLWTHSLNMEKQIFTKNPSCRVCGKRQQIRGIA